MYIAMNSNIVQFTETLNDILEEVSQMPCSFVGDYNIDALKTWASPAKWKISWSHAFELFITYDFQTN